MPELPFSTIILIVISLAVVVIILRIGIRIFGQVTQLSFQNRLLVALRHLDIATMSIIEVEPICQKIVNVIGSELGYFFGAVALLDNKAGGLRRIAISSDAELDSIIKKLPIEYSKQVIPLIATDNLLIKVLTQRKNLYTTSLHDIQKGIFATELSDKIQKTIRLKGLFVHPLIAKRGVIGVIYYATLVEREKLSRFEFEIMDEFTREVSRVLENVFLFQDLKEISQKLETANKKLKELDQLKDDFVSVASHELRTPMTAIRSYVWMALHRSDIHLSQKLEKYLYRTLVSTERLINLVNDLLNVSRIESGRIEINPKSFSIVELVRDVVEEVKAKANEKRLLITVMEHALPFVFADADKVHQILLNLIGNALKFTYPGGQIIIDFFTDGQMVETSVKDTGTGITKEDLGKLFHKFSRLENSYTAISTSGGTGLGLFISKNLVEVMRGKIWASSEGAEQGSIFTFSLPAATRGAIEHADEYAVKSRGEAKPLEPFAI